MRTSSPRLSVVRSSGAASSPFSFDTDRKSTRLNSSHLVISYAVFCLKKKKNYFSFLLCHWSRTPPLYTKTDTQQLHILQSSPFYQHASADTSTIIALHLSH